MGLYLKQFLGVTTLQKEWTLKGTSDALSSLRVWDKLQTVPKDNYKLAKEIIESNGKGGQKVAAKKKWSISIIIHHHIHTDMSKAGIRLKSKAFGRHLFSKWAGQYDSDDFLSN